MHPDSPLAKMIDAATLKRWQVTAKLDDSYDPAASVRMNGQKSIGASLKKRSFTATVHALDRADAWRAYCDSTGHRGSPKAATIEVLA